MIEFKQRSLWESIKRLYPPYRRKKDEEMREAIRQLIANPDAPCVIEGVYVPNGYGHYTMRLPFDKL